MGMLWHCVRHDTVMATTWQCWALPHHGHALEFTWRCHCQAMAFPSHCHNMAAAFPWQCQGNVTACLWQRCGNGIAMEFPQKSHGSNAMGRPWQSHDFGKAMAMSLLWYCKGPAGGQCNGLAMAMPRHYHGVAMAWQPGNAMASPWHSTMALPLYCRGYPMVKPWHGDACQCIGNASSIPTAIALPFQSQYHGNSVAWKCNGNGVMRVHCYNVTMALRHCHDRQG